MKHPADITSITSAILHNWKVIALNIKIKSASFLFRTRAEQSQYPAKLEVNLAYVR